MDETLTELHTHVGAGVSPEILWSMAHQQGIKIKAKNYWEFEKMIIVQPGAVKSLEEYTHLFELTELVQSSPLAIERSVYEIIGGAYRKNNITRLELRFNPMKRNRGGEQDLDHIIMAAVRGLDRAMLEYPIKVGLIFCLDNNFSYKHNEIILKKAIKYRERGVVGIDIAGSNEKKDKLMECKPLFKQASDAGLGCTAHIGEENKEGIAEALEISEITRLGHGIHAAWDERLMDGIKSKGVTLEICHSSNLNTKALKSIEELKFVLQTFAGRGVKFTINTDGPEMIQTSLRKERKLLMDNGILNQDQLDQTELWSREASFLR